MGKITTATTKFIEGMAFETEVGGHKIIIDAEEKVGGKNLGPSPKPLILNALSGCTAMDVISILRKMRVEPEEFVVEVEANNTDEHPKYFDTIKLIYKFKGKDLPMSKLEKAVSLSQERYCGVSYMLSKTVEITHEIVVEE